MATKRVVNLSTVSGWIGNTTAFAAHTITIDIPVGPRYHQIAIRAHPGSGKKLIHVDSTRDGLLGEMRLKVNGKVQRVFTAAELNSLNVLNGANYACKGGLTDDTEAELTIYFAEPWRENVETEDGLAWATGDVDTFQLEIDIKEYTSGTYTGLTKPTCKAVVDNTFVKVGDKMVDAPMGAIVKVFSFQAPSASGWNDYMQLPKRDLYQSIHLVDYANHVEFEVKVDNNIIRQDTKAGNEAKLASHGMLQNPTKTATPLMLAADLPNSTDTTSRGMIDIVFDHDDRVSSSLPMNFHGRRVGDFNLRFSTTTSGTVKIITQTLGPAE